MSLPVVHSLLLGVLPGLALRIFVMLLPVILYGLNRRAGPVGAAQLDGWVATHFFGMQVRVQGRLGFRVQVVLAGCLCISGKCR